MAPAQAYIELRGRSRNSPVFPPEDSFGMTDLAYLIFTWIYNYQYIFHMTGTPNDLPFGYEIDADNSPPHIVECLLSPVIFFLCESSSVVFGTVGDTYAFINC